MKTRRIVSLVLALALLLAVTAGCSSGTSGGTAGGAAVAEATSPGGQDGPAASADPGKPIAKEINFWHCMGGKIGEAVEETVASFNAAQSDIHVTSAFQGTYDEALTKIKAALQSGDAPDAFQMFELGTRYLADSGLTIPAQDMMEKDPSVKLEDLEPYLVDYYTVNGKFQCIPFNPSTPILYYNKDAFREAGLDPEKPPATYDELNDYAAKLVKRDGNKITQYGFAFFIYGWFFENAIAGQGKVFANNDNGRTAPATAVEFDQNGAGLAAANMFKKLIDSGNVVNYNRVGADAKSAFMSGQAAICLESTAQLSTITEGVGGAFEIGTGYLPKVAANQDGGVIIGGGNLWVYDSKDEARINSAWEFIKYATSPEVAGEFSRKTGYFAANKKAYDLPEMQAFLEEYPAFKTAINQLHDNPVNNYTQGASLGVFVEIRSAYEQNMELILQGSVSPEDGIAATAKTANDAIANYNKTMGLG